MGIFLIECSAPHWLDVASRLHARGVRVSLWTGWSQIETEVRSRFPGADFHETFRAKIGVLPDGPVPLGGFDAACQLVWKEEAQVVYDMMNRFDHSRDQTFVERSTLFIEHLVYWRSVLREYDPEVVVFSTPPHVVYDYVILALCRALNIRTLMFEQATIYPPYCLAMSDYRGGSLTLAEAARKQHQVSDRTRAIAAQLRGDYATAKPRREAVAQAEMRRQIAEGLAGLKASAKTIEETDRQHRGEYSVNEKIVNVGSAYKEKGRPLRESFAGSYANTRFMNQRIDQFVVAQEMRDFYHANVTPLENVTEPFVYVALAGQPERTSNPQAGIFANQLLMVNILAYGSGMQVVVREHPNQFHPGFSGPMCRDTGYYTSLLRMGVHLVSTSEDPFAIIDRSTMVATTGGTSALEAAARGKPALLFGDAWYRDCPGVYRVRSMADVKELLCQDVPGPAPGAFENYAEAITQGCFRGLGDWPPADYEFDRDENVSELTRAVLDSLGA